MAGEEQIGEILLSIFVLIVVAKVLGLLCEWATRAMRNRIVIPAVIGEIVGGIIIGNTLLMDRLNLNPGSMNGDMFFILSQLGVIFLIFAVGLETPYSELRRVGRTAFLVALLGVILPFLGGYALFLAYNYSNTEAMFVGAAMVATSVGITARVIKDMNLTHTLESKIIIGAAVIDDVMGLIVLSLVVGISSGSGEGLVSVGIVAVEAIVFVLGIMFIGGLISKVRNNNRKMMSEGEICPPITPEGRTLSISALSLAIILCLGISYAAIYIGLAAIVGAFLAGMVFAEFQDKWFCQDKIEAINEFLVPFFFLYVGTKVHLNDFSGILALAIILTIIAIITKFVGCGIGAYKMGGKSAAIVGSGMFPRGEVAMIVAAIGLNQGVVEQSVYAIVVFMAIATTLVAPPLLTYFFQKKYGKTPIVPEMKGQRCQR
ncbi:MAG: cation:proton antiporter [Methanomassiliicoccales archaeon]|nr:cation:proton antiporter [Methanomassiliicoccales archaeon]